MLGFSAAKTFHVNKYLGAVTGGALVYPTMVAAATAHKAITFFGLPVNLMNYSQTMLPIVFAIWGMSWFEKGTKKVVPKVVQNLFVPLLDLMVIVPLTYLIVGPVMQTLSQWLSSASLWLYGLVPVVAGFVIGGIWQAAVIVGLHWAFIPVLMNNLMTNHFDPINGIMYCTLFGQVGAALAMGLKAKDKNFKEIAIPAAVSGFFGVTEPIIYGVTLPHKKSFVFASIGSAFGGAIAAAFHAGMYTMPGGGIFGIPAFINPKGIDASFIAFVISLIVAFALAFILTFIWGDKVVPATPKKKFDVKKVEFKDQGIAAPIQGTAVELLIHLGINTVNLKGKYFDAKVAAGQKVKQGDLLETFDVDQIKAAGYDTVVPIIVTNTNNFDDIIVEKKDGDSVKFGDQILMATVDQEVEIPVNATQA